MGGVRSNYRLGFALASLVVAAVLVGLTAAHGLPTDPAAAQAPLKTPDSGGAFVPSSILVQSGPRPVPSGGAGQGILCDPCPTGPQQVLEEDAPVDTTSRIPRRETVKSCRERVPHPPVRITENAGPRGFVVDPPGADSVPRPGSGVVAGNGTAANPYVIAGWCIGSSSSPPSFVAEDPAPGILIRDTRAHVVVRDNVIVGAAEVNSVGVRVRDAANVTLRDNQVHNNDWGIRVLSSTDVEVTENVVRWNGWDGIDVVGTDRTIVANNTATQNGRDGIRVVGSDGSVVVNNSATDNDLGGVYLEGSSEVRVLNNTASRNRDGITFVESHGVVIQGNTAEDNRGVGWFGNIQGFGIGAVDADGGVVRENDVAGSGWRGLIYNRAGNVSIVNNTVRDTDEEVGLFLKNLENASVTSNVVAGNPVGVRVEADAEGLGIHCNNIHDNAAAGVNATAAHHEVNATRNWWGCPDGPGEPGCDGVAGDVVVDPWLEAPAPSAGSGT